MAAPLCSIDGSHCFPRLAFFLGAYRRQKLNILAYLIVSEGVFGLLEGSMHSLLYEMYMSNGRPDHMEGPADARSERGRKFMHRDIGVG